MPYAFGCPKCGSKLKTANRIPEDRAIQCPKCKNTFTTKDTEVEEVAAAAPPLAPSAAAAPRRPEPEEAPVRSRSREEPASRSPQRDENDEEEATPRRSRRRDEDDQDDRRSRSRNDEADPPRRRRDEDEDDDRRSRRREEESRDEDRPRSRRRSEEDDDRPSRRRRDEDDERPSRRRRDEDDDDRPLRRSRKKQGSNTGVMIGIIVLVLLLVGGLVALLVWLFGGSSNFDKEMLSYMPKNTMGLVGVDIESNMRFQNTKNALQEQPIKQAIDELKQKVGLTPDDLQRVIVGFTSITPNQEPDGVIAIRFKKSIEKDKIIKELGGQKKESNGSAYYVGNKLDKACITFPADDLMVFASKESVMTDSVLKSDGTIRFSEELQEMAKPISKNQFWGAMLVGADLRQQMNVPPQAKQGIAAMLPKVAPLIDFLGNAKGFAFYIHDDGSETKIALGMKLGDSAEAGKFSDAAKEAVSSSMEQLMNFAGMGGFQVPEDVKSFVTKTAKNTTTDRNGDVGYVVIVVEDTEAIKLTEKYKNQMNNNMGGNAPFGPGIPNQNMNPRPNFPPKKR